jgi:hypothetical protein
MKSFVFAAFALTICASPCFAQGARGGAAHGAVSHTASNTSRAAAVLGRDGQDARQRCSAENPNIEYRDCVNASTRDPNAKIRLG